MFILLFTVTNPISLMTDRILTTTVDGDLVMMTLPEVLAALSQKEKEVEFPKLRPHQHGPWQQFLCQLAAMAALDQNKWPGYEVQVWKEALLDLSDGNEAAWCLVVDSEDTPAFLQSPSKGKPFSPEITYTPDDIDVVVTAKCWDVKPSTIVNASPEHWVFALVTLQTTAGYLGARNYGVMRVKSGFAARPRVTLASSLSMNASFSRDAKVLIEEVETTRKAFQFGDKHKLIWLEPWDGESMLKISDIHPYAIEVCRFVRLQRQGDKIIARTKGSSAPRIDAKTIKGKSGDPWQPMDTNSVKADITGYNIGNGISYRTLQQILLSDRFIRTPLQTQRRREAPAQYLIVQGVGRDETQNGVTTGYHEANIPIPNEISLRFDDQAFRQKLAATSQAQVELAREVSLRGLKPALCSVLQGANESTMSLDLNDVRTQRWLSDFDRAIQNIFFGVLWQSASLSDADFRSSWCDQLGSLAMDVLERASKTATFHEVRKIGAESRGIGILTSCLQKLRAPKPEEASAP